MSGTKQHEWLLCVFAILLCTGRPLFGQNVPRNYLSPVTSPGPEGLTGEYFNNLSFGGKPVLVRTDPSPNFDFKDVSPGSGVDTKSFDCVADPALAGQVSARDSSWSLLPVQDTG